MLLGLSRISAWTQSKPEHQVDGACRLPSLSRAVLLSWVGPFIFPAVSNQLGDGVTVDGLFASTLSTLATELKRA